MDYKQNQEKIVDNDEKSTIHTKFDIESRNLIVERNMRLALKIANSFHNTGIEREDLISISFLGLVKAADKFKPDLGNEFATFAVPVIRNEILYELRHKRKHPYPKESINDIIYNQNDGGICERIDLIESDFDIEDILLCNNLKEVFNQVLKNEKTRNQKIITLFIGGDKQGIIASKMGLSQSYISRVIKQFKNKVIKKYQSV